MGDSYSNIFYGRQQRQFTTGQRNQHSVFDGEATIPVSDKSLFISDTGALVANPYSYIDLEPEQHDLLHALRAPEQKTGHAKALQIIQLFHHPRYHFREGEGREDILVQAGKLIDKAEALAAEYGQDVFAYLDYPNFNILLQGNVEDISLQISAFQDQIKFFEAELPKFMGNYSTFHELMGNSPGYENSCEEFFDVLDSNPEYCQQSLDAVNARYEAKIDYLNASDELQALRNEPKKRGAAPERLFERPVGEIQHYTQELARLAKLTAGNMQPELDFTARKIDDTPPLWTQRILSPSLITAQATSAPQPRLLKKLLAGYEEKFPSLATR